jgi:hypothetical protein
MQRMPGQFPPNVRPLLNGVPWGEVFPTKANPPALAIDGRTAALRVLRDYTCALQFYRENKPGLPPIAFKIDPANFHIEWPDATQALVFPSIAIYTARADYNVIGLVSYVEEETRDVFALGTVVQWQAEYIETINVEIWAETKGQRRGMLAALETAFSPTEQMSGLRFDMPQYYNEKVCFTLMRRELMDTPDSARNRRSAQLEIEMRFNIIALVNYVPLIPQVAINVDVDQSDNTPIDIVTDSSARLTGDLAALAKQLAG